MSNCKLTNVYRAYVWPFFLCLNFFSSLAFAQEVRYLSAAAPYRVCFTPQGACTSKIVELIDGASKEIDAQIYSFTSKKIAYALKNAVSRGVKVKVIYDQSNFDTENHHFSLAEYLTRHGALCRVDDSVRIAHNKVLIIDHQWVVTGSFNFTYAAEFKNAENVLMIKSSQLVDAYFKNFTHRWSISKNCRIRYGYSSRRQ